MYTETLVTPHPLKAKGDETAFLEDALQLECVRERLNDLAATDPAAYESAKIEAATCIAQAVNKSLWFPIRDINRNDFKTMGLPYPLPLDTLSESQVTNCYGYTLATSECLDKAGISHWIGYANGHAFTLVPFADETAKDVQLIDALSPNLNQPLRTTFAVGSMESIETEIGEHGRAVIMIDTQKVAVNVGGSITDLSDKHPWLLFEGKNQRAKTSNRYMGTTERSEIAKYVAQYSLVTSIFPSAEGRRTIEEYVAFGCAMSRGDIDGACVSLQNMSGYYPEIDARQSHEEMRNLSKRLSVTDPQLATDLIEEYFIANFGLSQDSRILEARGDLQRAVARRSGVATAADRAVDAYKSAVEKPKAFHAALAGKLAAAQSLALTLRPVEGRK